MSPCSDCSGTGLGFKVFLPSPLVVVGVVGCNLLVTERFIGLFTSNTQTVSCYSVKLSGSSSAKCLNNHLKVSTRPLESDLMFHLISLF